MSWATGFIGTHWAGAVVATAPSIDRGPESVGWVAWRRSSRMEGFAPSERDAALALLHFFEQEGHGDQWARAAACQLEPVLSRHGVEL